MRFVFRCSFIAIEVFYSALSGLRIYLLFFYYTYVYLHVIQLYRKFFLPSLSLKDFTCTTKEKIFTLIIFLYNLFLRADKYKKKVTIFFCFFNNKLVLQHCTNRTHK